MKPKPSEFPFKCFLSLEPLIRLWREAMSGAQPVKAVLADKMQEALKKAPELLKPIEDLRVLDRHKDLVGALMSIAFPASRWERDYAAAFIPFKFISFYETPLFRRFLMSDEGSVKGRKNIDEEQMGWGRIINAYIGILNEFYDIDVAFDYPLIVTTTDPETGLERHFRMDMDCQFLDIKQVGKPKTLSKAVRKQLLANLTDPDILMDLLPPEDFEFHGFIVVNFMDVTDQEIISSLKRDLIEKESIFSQQGFERLEEKMKAFLKQPDLHFGLSAIESDRVYILNPRFKLDQGCIYADSHHLKKCDFEGSVFDQAVQKGEPLVIEDLPAHPNRTPLEEEFIQKGVRSLFVAPLYYQKDLIGTIDLKSPRTGALHAMSVMKMLEVLPLFSMALKRGMEELNTRVQAIIKEKCTAIHPSVEWRFREAALNFMTRQDETQSELEPIVFRDVYPLYGVSDIRGSTEHRNASIQADLIEHLTLTKEIILLANGQRPLPILDAMAHRIDKHIGDIEAGLGSGDETTKLDFIRYVVEPVFDHIQEFGPAVRERIETYRAALDPNLRTIYQRRRDFEETISQINETLSCYIEQKEAEAQLHFPHYFEKLQTDGVDHSIYIGASMVEGGKFDGLYLKNLRLWQLMMMCGVVREAERLKNEVKVPLECSHLILVQDAPLSIRFRPDEKRFDVDGAYDIRHEIIKKRIDKAVIKGKTERLTQPGKIAIVYSHRREALEYREYIEYLQSEGYLADQIETLDLQDLQGITGLKALRIAVEIQPGAADQQIAPQEIARAVQSMPSPESA